MDNLVCLGQIVSSHALQGAVKIKTYTENPEELVLYGDLTDGKTNYQVNIESIVSHNFVIAKIKNVSTREHADRLRGTKLFIHRSKLKELEDNNEFYHVDLIGLDVYANNTLYGTVKDILNFGANDIVEIELTESKKKIMFPFTKEFFPSVDLEKKTIILSNYETIN